MITVLAINTTCTIVLSIDGHLHNKMETNCMYSMITIYNKLPARIKEINSIQAFKNSLKKYLCDVEPYSLQEFLGFDGQ